MGEFMDDEAVPIGLVRDVCEGTVTIPCRAGGLWRQQLDPAGPAVIDSETVIECALDRRGHVDPHGLIQRDATARETGPRLRCDAADAGERRGVVACGREDRIGADEAFGDGRARKHNRRQPRADPAAQGRGEGGARRHITLAGVRASLAGVSASAFSTFFSTWTKLSGVTLIVSIPYRTRWCA